MNLLYDIFVGCIVNNQECKATFGCVDCDGVWSVCVNFEGEEQ